MTVPVPDVGWPFSDFDSMRFVVTCEESLDAEPVAEGELLVTGEDVSDTDATVLLWQALVDGLPPRDCRTSIVVRDDTDEVICISAETVSIAAGKVTESRASLVCSLES